MARDVWIGIDPGLSGAVAIIFRDEIGLFDVPTRKASRGEVMVAPLMAELLKPYAGLDDLRGA